MHAEHLAKQRKVEERAAYGQMQWRAVTPKAAERVDAETLAKDLEEEERALEAQRVEEERRLAEQRKLERREEERRLAVARKEEARREAEEREREAAAARVEEEKAEELAQKEDARVLKAAARIAAAATAAAEAASAAAEEARSWSDKWEEVLASRIVLERDDGSLRLVLSGKQIVGLHSALQQNTMQRAVAFWSDGKKVRLAAEVVNALRRRLDGRMHERSLDAELVLKLPSSGQPRASTAANMQTVHHHSSNEGENGYYNGGGGVSPGSSSIGGSSLSSLPELGGRYTSSAPADHQRRPLSQQWLRATQAQAGGVLQDGRLPSWSLPRLVPGVLTGRGALDSLAEDV